jgi:hypothetical protein
MQNYFFQHLLPSKIKAIFSIEFEEDIMHVINEIFDFRQTTYHTAIHGDKQKTQ